MKQEMPMTTELEKELKSIVEIFEKVRRELQASAVPELLKHVEQIGQLRPQHRLPIAFIGKPEGGHYSGTTQPSVRCKPTHLVLSEATAEAYDIEMIQVANVNANIGDKPLPGELFSVEFYQKSPELLEVMAFDIAWITPAHRVTLFANIKEGALQTEFRGIVWCGVQRLA